MPLHLSRATPAAAVAAAVAAASLLQLHCNVVGVILQLCSPLIPDLHNVMLGIIKQRHML
jgi:hypothetical protein